MVADIDRHGGAVMDYQALKTEIETGPLASECVGQSDDVVAAILNDKRYTATKERYVTARTVLAELGATIGAAILDKMEAAATQSSPVKWMLKFLTQDSGIDVGQSETQGCIDALAMTGVLTSDEATALKNMALLPASRAEILGFGAVSYNDINTARAL